MNKILTFSFNNNLLYQIPFSLVYYHKNNFNTYSIYRNVSNFIENKRKLYCIGSSNILGIYIDNNQLTIPSLLQKEFPNYSVYNYGIQHSDLINNYFQIFTQVDDNSDIILEIGSYYSYFFYDKNSFIKKKMNKKFTITVLKNIIQLCRKKKCNILLYSIIKNEFFNSELFEQFIIEDRYKIDRCHLTEEGNIILVNNFLKERLKNKKFYDKEVVIDNKDDFIEWINNRKEFYYEKLKHSKSYMKYKTHLESLNAKYGKENNGLICTAGNPLTNGHLKLIEYASKKVDTLYIDTLCSDKLFFSSKDRYNMIKEATSHISNVVVIDVFKARSSDVTFSDYIYKQSVFDIDQVNFTYEHDMDIHLLCKLLNIKIRFFGEEEHDKITKINMDKFKELAEKNNIQCEIIPRFKEDGKEISATNCRQMIKEKKFDELKKYIPKKVFDYILSNKYN